MCIRDSYWTAEEVDTKLKGIMKNIYHSSVEVAERYGLGYDLAVSYTHLDVYKRQCFFW